MSETKDWKTVPVYRHTGEYARFNGELNAYRASAEANQACKAAIEQIIRENFDGIRLPGGLAEQIIDQFGEERVAYLLANTVQQKHYDGRFGRDNKNWAASIPILPDIGYGHDRNIHFVIETHPAVLDGFIRHARTTMEPQTKVSLHEQLKKAQAVPAAPVAIPKESKQQSQKRSTPVH